jgi:hypothetical protein
MPNENGGQQLPVERRMEIFYAVVEAQDRALGTVRARQLVSRQFGVSENDVRPIEDEGLQQEWPPL